MKRMALLVFAFVAVATLWASRPASGSTVTQDLWLYDAVSADTYIDESRPTLNFDGGVEGLLLGFHDTIGLCDVGGCDTLIQLTLASIPQNIDIQRAIVYPKLYRYDAPSSEYEWYVLERITSSWTEGSVTWNSKPSTTSYGLITALSKYKIGDFVPVDITDMFKGWYSGSTTNYGFQMSWNANEFLARFWDSEEANPDERPRLNVIYTTRDATVNPFYYCDGGPCELGVFSGSGLAPWLFKVEAAEGSGAYKRVNPESISTNLSTVLHVRVKDFFNNELYNASRTISTNPYYWDIGIPYRLLKLSNQRDFLTTVTISPAGGTPIVMDLLPREIWSAPLKSAIIYYLNFTLKDENQNAIQTLSLTRNMTAARSYIVNGTTITEVITNVDGLSTTIQHLQFVSPITLEGRNLPFVPVVRLSPDPALPALISAYPVQMVQYTARKNGTGDPIALWRPLDKNLPSDEVNVLSDELYLAGSWTRIYFNDTKDTIGTGDDTTLGTTTSALSYWQPASASMGKNISVDTVSGVNVRADRASRVRLTENFNWSFNADENVYSVNVIVENSAPTPWSDLSTYFAFPADITADIASVVVYDLDNANIALTPGQHYSADGLGVYMGLTSLASGAERNFRITFSPYSQAEFAVIRLDATSAVPDNSFTGTAFRARVTYAQPAGSDFLGDVVVSIKISDPSFANRLVDMNSLVIVDVRTGSRLPNWFPHPTQTNVLVIPDARIPASTVQDYDIYFAFKPASSSALGAFSEFLGSDLGGVVFILAVILALIFGVAAAKDRVRRRSGGS